MTRLSQFIAAGRFLMSKRRGGRGAGMRALHAQLQDNPGVWRTPLVRREKAWRDRLGRSALRHRMMFG